MEWSWMTLSHDSATATQDLPDSLGPVPDNRHRHGLGSLPGAGPGGDGDGCR
jgi:hypothetical protein